MYLQGARDHAPCGGRWTCWAGPWKRALRTSRPQWTQRAMYRNIPCSDVSDSPSQPKRYGPFSCPRPIEPIEGYWGNDSFPKLAKLTATKGTGALGVDIASPIPLPHVVSIETLVPCFCLDKSCPRRSRAGPIGVRAVRPHRAHNFWGPQILARGFLVPGKLNGLPPYLAFRSKRGHWETDPSRRSIGL
jgi:hypothetical protein